MAHEQRLSESNVVSVVICRLSYSSLISVPCRSASFTTGLFVSICQDNRQRNACLIWVNILQIYIVQLYYLIKFLFIHHQAHRWPFFLNQIHSIHCLHYRDIYNIHLHSVRPNYNYAIPSVASILNIHYIIS